MVTSHIFRYPEKEKRVKSAKRGIAQDGLGSEPEVGGRNAERKNDNAQDRQTDNVQARAKRQETRRKEKNYGQKNQNRAFGTEPPRPGEKPGGEKSKRYVFNKFQEKDGYKESNQE